MVTLTLRPSSFMYSRVVLKSFLSSSPFSGLIDAWLIITFFVVFLKYAHGMMPLGEARDWQLYMLIPVVCAITMLVVVCSRFTSQSAFVQKYAFPIALIKLLVATFGFVFVAYFFIAKLSVSVLIPALFIAAYVGVDHAISGKTKPTVGNSAEGAYLAIFFLVAVSVFAQLLWNKSLDLQLSSHFPIQPIALVLAALFIHHVLKKTEQSFFAIRKWLYIVLHIAAFSLFVFLGFRFDHFPDWWHWQAIVEPAVTIRSGGWLLWDTPAQYGFLQPLLIAWLPAKSVWYSFYLLNGALITLNAYAIFALFFNMYRTLASFICAVILAACCTSFLLMHNYSVDFRAFPAGGPVRFVWGIVLLLYTLAIQKYFVPIIEKKRISLVYAAGTVLWIIGCLWSVESAFFSSVVWLPVLAFCAVAEKLSSYPEVSWKTLARYCLYLEAGALFTLLIVIWLIARFYLYSLGQWPDFQMFIEYAQSFKNGYYAMPIDYEGNGYSLVIVFMALFMMAMMHIRYMAFTSQHVLHCMCNYACLVLLWASSCYFISRSHPNIPVNLLATSAITLLGGYLLTKSPTIPPLMKESYKLIIVALFCISLNAIVSDIIDRTFKLSLYLKKPIMNDVTTLFRPSGRAGNPTSKQLLDLVEQAGMPKGAYILTLDSLHSLFDLKAKTWILPNSRTSLHTRLEPSPLNPQRLALFAMRRAANGPAEGWVIEPRTDRLENYSWLKKPVEKYYVELAGFENTHFRIRHFIRKDP